MSIDATLAPRDHSAQGLVRAIDGTHQVDLHGSLEDRNRRRREVAAFVHRGVVDQDEVVVLQLIEVAEQLGHRRRVGHVGNAGREQGAVAARRAGVQQRRFVSSNTGDTNIAFREADRKGTPQPRPCASDYGEGAWSVRFPVAHATSTLSVPISCSPKFATIPSPTRNAFAAMVRLGLTPLDVGMNDESTQ